MCAGKQPIALKWRRFLHPSSSRNPPYPTPIQSNPIQPDPIPIQSNPIQTNPIQPNPNPIPIPSQSNPNPIPTRSQPDPHPNPIPSHPDLDPDPSPTVQVIQERATPRVVVNGPADGMLHRARHVLCGIYAPELLQTDPVGLRLGSFSQTKLIEDLWKGVESGGKWWKVVERDGKGWEGV